MQHESISWKQHGSQLIRWAPHLCRCWRSWDQTKSSMPVGVIEKDTVLFAVPKKGRTCCGMWDGWMTGGWDECLKFGEGSQKLQKFWILEGFLLNCDSYLENHGIFCDSSALQKNRICHLQSLGIIKRKFSWETFNVQTFAFTQHYTHTHITSHTTSSHITHCFAVGITSHLKILHHTSLQKKEGK